MKQSIENILGDSLLTGVTLKTIEPYIFSVIQDSKASNSFDDMAKFYDLVICNRYYNRIMWGYDISSYETLTNKALNSTKNGLILDAGCGSLAFTAKTYANYTERPIILFDQSIKLLKIAKSRVVKIKGGMPANMIFLQADALQLPFKPNSFETIISLNLIHVFDDITGVISDLKNVLSENGTMSFSTLIKNSRITDKYLDVMLKKTSGVAPKTFDQLQKYFAKRHITVNHEIRGNMAFLTHGFQ